MEMDRVHKIYYGYIIVRKEKSIDKWYKVRTKTLLHPTSLFLLSWANLGDRLFTCFPIDNSMY